MIYRGLRKVDPPLVKLLIILGLSPPNNSSIGFAFESVFTLLSKCFVLLWSIMYCCMVIETFLILNYILLVLN